MASKNKRRGSRRPGKPVVGTKPGQGNIPVGARYVNETNLDDDIIERIVKLSQNPVMRYVYFVVGGAAILLAVVTYLLLGADLVMSLIIMAFGGTFIYQGVRLPRRSAKRAGMELDRAGEDARRRVTFFTATEMGTVNRDGSVHTLPYSAIETIYEDDRIFALKMAEDGSFMALSKAGFTHGNPADFGPSIEKRVTDARKQLTDQLRRGKRQGPGAGK